MEGILYLGIAIFLIWLLVKGGNETTEVQIIAKSEMEKQMICPYCQTKGSVTTQKIKQKTGIHGGKATAALLTCGISLLGTGLSRKQKITQANCSNCGSVYTF